MIPWRRKWQTIPVFLPVEFYGQRSLVGYSPRGGKLDMTEQLTLHVYVYTHTHTHTTSLSFHPLMNTWLSEWSRSVLSDSLWPHGRWLPGSSVHGIFQARLPEWIAISFSRGSSWPRDQTQVSRIAGRRFTHQGIAQTLRLFLYIVYYT